MNYGRGHLELLARFDYLNWSAASVDRWIKSKFKVDHPSRLTSAQVRAALKILNPERKNEAEQDAMGTSQFD